MNIIVDMKVTLISFSYLSLSHQDTELRVLWQTTNWICQWIASDLHFCQWLQICHLLFFMNACSNKVKKLILCFLFLSRTPSGSDVWLCIAFLYPEVYLQVVWNRDWYILICRWSLAWILILFLLPHVNQLEAILFLLIIYLISLDAKNVVSILQHQFCSHSRIFLETNLLLTASEKSSRFSFVSA